MNCYIVPGNDSFEDLCTKIKDGFVVQNLAGLHAGLDFVSTNFLATMCRLLGKGW